MCNLSISLNIINFVFTIINVFFSIILQAEKKSFNSATTTTLVRYRYFEDVLLNPYFKLIMTSLFYDILYYSGKFLLVRYFFDIKSESNEENVRTKSIRENMVSNIMVEFLFMTMIKGLALGFGFFYVIEIDKEIKRIIRLKDINNEQENALNSMISVVIINGLFNLMTMIYQFIFFGIRLYIACQKPKKKFLQENHLREVEKKYNSGEKGIKRVDSSGNISLPEEHGDKIIYEKLEQ